MADVVAIQGQWRIPITLKGAGSEIVHASPRHEHREV